MLARIVPRRRLAEPVAAVLAGGGLVAVMLAVAADRAGGPARLLTGEGRALLVAAGVGAVLALVASAQPARIAGASLVGLAGLVALAAAPTPSLAGLVVLGLAVAQSRLLAGRSFAARIRAPAAGVLLLAVGDLLTRSGAPGAARVGAVALALGVAAAAGLVPFLQELEAGEAVPAASIVWPGFVGPVLGVTVAGMVGALPEPGAAGAFEAVMVGLGLVNAVWGATGAWVAAGEASAWRHSMVADWGLAMAAIGLAGASGREAAYLLLLALPLVRLPLYLCARPGLLGAPPASPATSERRRDLLLVVTGVALAGAAPFAGFPARVLLLRAATGVGWPLALGLGLIMLAWLPGSLRLGRGLGAASGRALLVTGAALAISLGIGLYPAIFMAGAGFHR
ncbi:MAG: hypothetical protein ACREPA_05475 [Candidatus Dormibacteraceae bacterium]